MVISLCCLLCDSHRRVLRSSCQTNHQPRLGSTGSIHLVCQALSHFYVCLFPYYFLWLSKISITLGSGTENVLETPKVYILFYFYYFLWWLHYSLMPWVFPKIVFLASSFFSILFSAFPVLYPSCMAVSLSQCLAFSFTAVNGSQTYGFHRPVKLLPVPLSKRRDWPSVSSFYYYYFFLERTLRYNSHFR